MKYVLLRIIILAHFVTGMIVCMHTNTSKIDEVISMQQVFAHQDQIKLGRMPTEWKIKVEQWNHAVEYFDCQEMIAILNSVDLAHKLDLINFRMFQLTHQTAVCYLVFLKSIYNFQKYNESIFTLLKLKADPRIVDDRSNNIMHHVALCLLKKYNKPFLDTICTLIDHEVLIDLLQQRNYEHQTPLEILYKNGIIAELYRSLHITIYPFEEHKIPFDSEQQLCQKSYVLRSRHNRSLQYYMPEEDKKKQ